MTDNEILKADLLDILFEHRNKSYGAYILRRYYNHRLLLALGILLFAVILFFLIFLFNKSDDQSGLVLRNIDNRVTITELVIPKPKDPDQPKPRQPEPVAQKDFRTIKVVDDNKADKPIAEHEELINVAISDKDMKGVTPGDPGKSVTNAALNDSTGKQEADQPKKTVDLLEVQPSFPGGPQALALFFSRNLGSPSDLEPGEKRIVKVRFIVGTDGSITKTEVVQSGGDSYDREVLRAFRRMPKWNPAIQNGIKVATTFTQPVTFIGLEQ